jgi:sugar phosphate isomerase/epimerase
MGSSHSVVARASLSTMWAIGNFGKIADFVAVAHRIGFGQVEANYQLTPVMISELMGLRDKGRVIVSSVHDPASLPAGTLLSQLPQLSSPDDAERNLALSMSRKAIDLAAYLGATALVVHPGVVHDLPPLEARMRVLLKGGQAGGKESADLRQRLIAERAAHVGPDMQRVIVSLKEMAAYANGKGVRLGLENRYHYHEIPLPDEAMELLDALSGYDVGYWHDIGHAYVLDVLGFVDEMDFLRTLGPRTIGSHLHDAIGIKDHLPPGKGEIDFARSLPYLPDDALRVCELGSFNSEQEIADGFLYLRTIGYY